MVKDFVARYNGILVIGDPTNNTDHASNAAAITALGALTSTSYTNDKAVALVKIAGVATWAYWSGSAWSIPSASLETSITSASLKALRTANSLVPGMHYVVTDWVQGTRLAGTNKVQLHALSTSELSLHAQVDTPYDNTAWHGLYDIDLGTVGQMTYLEDNQGNRISGATNIGGFDWGNTNITNLELDASSSFFSVIGSTMTISNVKILSGTGIDLSGGPSGSIVRTSFSNLAGLIVLSPNTVNITNCSFRRGSVAIFSGGAVTLTDCEFDNLGGLQLQSTSGSCTISRSKFRVYQRALFHGPSAGNLTVTDCDFSGTNSAGNTGIQVLGSGTVNIARSKTSGLLDSVLNSSGATTITAREAHTSAIGQRVLELNGSGAVTINGLVQHNSASIFRATGTTGALTITNTRISRGHPGTNRVFDINGNGAVTVTSCEFDSNGNLATDATSTGVMILNGCRIQSSGHVRLYGAATSGISVLDSTISSYGNIFQKGTVGTALDLVSRCEVVQDGTIIFHTTGAGANVCYESRVAGHSQATSDGTPVVGGTNVATQGYGIIFYGATQNVRCEGATVNNGQIFIQDVSAGLDASATDFINNYVTSAGRLYILGTPATMNDNGKVVNHNVVTSGGRLDVLLDTAVTQVYNNNVSGQGYLKVNTTCTTVGYNQVSSRGTLNISLYAVDCVATQGGTYNTGAAAQTSCTVEGNGTVTATGVNTNKKSTFLAGIIA